MKNHISTYRLYGLKIRSEIGLNAPNCRCFQPDVDVHWEKGMIIPDIPPKGRILAGISYGNGQGYSLSKTTTHYLLRFYHTCEFRISHDFRSVSVHMHPNVDPDMAALLLSANVLAVILGLRGIHALHASAISVDGMALAFIGNTGMGKSTLTALFCENGAGFVTDDLLRLQPQKNIFRCFPGATEIRLRPNVAFLAEHFPDTVSRATPDGRTAIHHEANGRKLPRLHSIIIPYPSRTCKTVRIEKLSYSKALFSLMSYPRVLGWQEKSIVQKQFSQFGDLAKQVNVFEAKIPWGPPFTPDIVPSLLQGVGLKE